MCEGTLLRLRPELAIALDELEDALRPLTDESADAPGDIRRDTAAALAGELSKAEQRESDRTDAIYGVAALVDALAARLHDRGRLDRGHDHSLIHLLERETKRVVEAAS